MFCTRFWISARSKTRKALSILNVWRHAMLWDRAPLRKSLGFGCFLLHLRENDRAGNTRTLGSCWVAKNCGVQTAVKKYHIWTVIKTWLIQDVTLHYTEQATIRNHFDLTNQYNGLQTNAGFKPPKGKPRFTAINYILDGWVWVFGPAFEKYESK